MEKDRPSILDDTTTVVTKKEAKILSDLYYKEGMTFGRDALYHHLKTLYPKEEDRPSRRTVMKWLSSQKLHQEFQQTRSGGLTNYFTPTKPLQSISIDLIDFNFKPGKGNMKYILVVNDNFSRKMYTEAITSKKPQMTMPAMKKIIENKIVPDIKKIYGTDAGTKKLKYIISDDGSEWKSVFDEYLKSIKVARRRTLGGHPQQNAITERSNAKVKMLMAKLIKINGGSWVDWFPKATELFNKMYIRTTEYTPDEAMALPKDDWHILRKNVVDKHDNDIIVTKSQMQKGDKVRIKLNKGSMGKSSTPSWSSTLYEIAKVISNKNPQIADKYKVAGRAQDQSYSRNDLQKVKEVQEIPKKLTKKQQEEVASQLRLNEASQVEGAFNEEELAKDKAEFDKDYPDKFAEGAEDTEKQLKRMKKSSREANEGEKVERPQRQRKKVEVLDPSRNPSDAEIKGRTKEFEIQRIEGERGEGYDKEYNIKWVGYGSDQNTFEPAWKPQRGKKKRERNIPKSFVDEWEIESGLPQTEPIAAKTPPKKQKQTTVSAARGKKPRKLGF